jgi:hypothetical protein
MSLRGLLVLGSIIGVIVLIIGVFMSGFGFQSNDLQVHVSTIHVNHSVLPPDGKVFLVVDGTIFGKSPTNDGPTLIGPSQFVLVSDKGSTYGYDHDFTYAVPGTIDRGEWGSFSITFMLPANEVPRSMVLHWGVFLNTASCPTIT